MKNITPISRRQFIQNVVGGLTALTASFFILPSSLTYQRIWKFILSRPPEQVVSADAFTEFLLKHTPQYDAFILKDITPVDGWIGRVPMVKWEDWNLDSGVYVQHNPGPQFPSHDENGLPHQLYLPRG